MSDNVIKGPFAAEAIAQPAMDAEREKLAKHIAMSVDALIVEGIRRVTDEDRTAAEWRDHLQLRLRATFPANSPEITYYLDGEAFLVMLPPEIRNTEKDGQWFAEVDIFHRYLGKAAR